MTKPPRGADADNLIGLHRGLNRATAENWERFESHRRRVTALLAAMGAGDPDDRGPSDPARHTLAVLGAGNCNDLALDLLVPRFGQVHLFDIDSEALLRARARQSANVAERLVLHAPVDLGGALADLAKLRHRLATRDELGALPGTGVRQVVEGSPVRFSAVASTCLLSQLVHGCQRALGDEHPQIQAIACAIVVAHLRMLTRLINPGGQGLVVTDIVSSDTYPLEELWGQKPAWTLVDELEESGNHLSGTTPRFLRRIVKTDPVIAPIVASTSLEEPWLWRITEDECYLVYALRLQARP